MGSNQYRTVNWSSGQLLDEDTLNQLTQNQEFIKAESTDGLFTTASGIAVSQGLKIYGGRRTIGASTQSSIHVTVGFKRLFSTTCSPIVVTQILSTGQNQFHTVVRGVTQITPTHEGFIANIRTTRIEKGATKINKIYLDWFAMGF